MPHKYLQILYFALILLLIPLAIWLVPKQMEKADLYPPDTSLTTQQAGLGNEPPCKNEHPEWRNATVIDGVTIAESMLCNPDNPYDIAAFVKGVNQISMQTMMNTRLSEDALIKGNDLDGDGDPDVIRIKLEVIELNGATPDGEILFPTYDVAPGIQPGLWVFAPKTRGMAVKNYGSNKANYFLRAPSPVIRVEQGDKIFITLENTHYFPHTIHFHGVDHAWRNASGGDNDGVPVTGDAAVFPGESRTYELQPRHAGTMLYHCHVQTDKHFLMGLNGLFVVEENRPNNWLQTFNVGAGQVRHSSVAVKKDFDQEYDLHYQSIDKQLALTIQQANDPRLIAKYMNRVYNMTESQENYFLLNGHSFPYTLRDALIVAEPDQAIKLRIVNAQHSTLALHIHGHKATITHYDGVSKSPGQQITRDVYNLAAAQRLDLHLQTTNDGLHSYGPGIWLFHDHVGMGITTDGMSPGGNISVLVYKNLIDERGMPKFRAGAVDAFFNKSYYARQKPIWSSGDFTQLLGDAGFLTPNYLRLIGFGLSLGLITGLIIYIARGIKKN